MDPSPSPVAEADAPAAVEVRRLLGELLFRQRRLFFDVAVEFDLHPAQAGALMYLDGEVGLAMHEIARRLACDNSNVTGIVDRLEARGLAERRADQRDRRVKHVLATAEGLAIRDAIRERMSGSPRGVDRLSPDEQGLLRDLLARLAHQDG